MPTIVGIGRSNKLDPYEAGKEALTDALRSLQGTRPDFVFIFTTDSYPPAEIVEIVRLHCGKAQIAGCCSAGVITSEGLFYDSLVIMAINSDQLKFYNLLACDVINSPYTAGSEIVSNLFFRRGPKNTFYPETLILFPEGFECYNTELVKGAASVMGMNNYLVGGGSGDNLKFFKTYQIGEGKYDYQGVSATLVSTNVPVAMSYAHGWTPLSPPLTITKAQGRTIKEINGEPALTAYIDYFKDTDFYEDSRRENFPSFGMRFPIGLQEYDRYIIRDPWSALEDGSIVCVSEVPSKSIIRIMQAKPEDLLTAAKKAATEIIQILGKKPAFALVFNCISRALLLNEKAPDEIAIIREILGEDVPIAGFLTFGEIAGGMKASPALHNKAIVIWAVSS